ncbi:MAG: hypothetical protein HZB95_01665 [Nitrosomonadales bacterium]|nr:hypothetical protein [Nitrosomonadales bacterium]
MQRLYFGLGIVLLAHTLPALAGDSNQSSYAVSFGVGSGGGLSIRKALSDTDQIFAGFNIARGNYQSQTTSSGITTNSDSSSRGYSIFAGVRHFLEKEKLSKFVQLSISSGKYTSSGSGYSSTSKSTSITPVYGVEYFLAPDLSIEGVMGLSYTYSTGNSDSNGSVQSSSSGKSFSFPAVGTAITYYW